MCFTVVRHQTRMNADVKADARGCNICVDSRKVRVANRNNLRRFA